MYVQLILGTLWFSFGGVLICYQAEPADPELVMERLESAQQGLAEMSRISGIAQDTTSATANADSVLNPIDTFSNCLKPLKAFNSIVTGIAEVNISILIYV